MEPESGGGPLCIRVADITMRVAAAADGMSFHVDEPSSRFLVERGRVDVNVEAAWSDNTYGTGGQRLFDSGALWQLYRDGEGYLFSFTSPTAGPVPYKLAKFNSNFTDGKILLHEPYFRGRGSVHPLEYPLDELVITHYLAQHGGVEVHACGLVDPAGRGYLFAGQSGAGKTTLARLWQKRPGIRILSDDRVILRSRGGEIRMHGTPWHGEGKMARPENVRLRKIFLLRQGSDNQLIQKKNVSAVSRLLACSFPPFHSRRAMDSVLDFLDRVVTSVPCFELMFTPDERVISIVEAENV